MKCSICIATYCNSNTLGRVLNSIFSQNPGFEFEVIVAHDSVPDDVDQRVKNLYARVSFDTPYRNSAIARNMAMKQAKGETLILQSDDVVHQDADTIERLVNDLESTEFLLATVINVKGELKCDTYVSPNRPKRRFFLGSVLREHIFKIGGHYEGFPEPGCEDDWLGDCLEYGLGLTPTFSYGIVGLHQDHWRSPDLDGCHDRMRAIRRRMAAAARIDPAKWIGGPSWPIPTA